MFENISHHKIKTGTERNFGLVFAAVFVIISLYPLWFGKNIHLWINNHNKINIYLLFKKIKNGIEEIIEITANSKIEKQYKKI